MIKRREFIAGLGSAAAWPVVARAQQPARTPVIGWLSRSSASADENILAVFRTGLSEIGFVERRDVAIEYRYANSGGQGLRELAADLVRRQVSVIAALGEQAANAAKALTTTIPIAFATIVDPVEYGLVASFNRPGGNITGVTLIMSPALGTKKLGILHDLLPGAKRFALLSELTVLGDAPGQNGPAMAAAAAKIGAQLDVYRVASAREIDAAFAAMLQNKVEALVIGPTRLFAVRRAQILTLAARHGLPTMYSFRDDVVAGGLISYSYSATEGFHQLGIYTGRILKGENPSDLPVMQPTKFELVLNLQTARTLGLTIPETLLATADEIIQ
jgi:putative ABC transport system substrate-binding protein